MSRPARIAANALLGALAGAAATWVMTQSTAYLPANEAGSAKRRERAARGGLPTYENAADVLASMVGRQLTDEQRQRWSVAIHWAVGIGTGAAYGAAHTLSPKRRAAKGLGFGALFFVGMDEVANTVFGFTPPPRHFPWQTHLRGLVGHLVYGLVTEAGLALIEPAGAGGAKEAWQSPADDPRFYPEANA